MPESKPGGLELYPRLVELAHPKQLLLRRHAAEGVELNRMDRLVQAQVFCTTMLGNFEVMSRCESAIFTAQRRAIFL